MSDGFSWLNRLDVDEKKKKNRKPLWRVPRVWNSLNDNTVCARRDLFVRTSIAKIYTTHCCPFRHCWDKYSADNDGVRMWPSLIYNSNNIILPNPSKIICRLCALWGRLKLTEKKKSRAFHKSTYDPHQYISTRCFFYFYVFFFRHLLVPIKKKMTCPTSL